MIRKPITRMRARKRGAKIWYYYDTGGKPRKEIPLGSDYALAIKKWAEIESSDCPQIPQVITLRYVAERYVRDIVPTKAHATQKDNLRELAMIYKFFDAPPAPLDKIQPQHIRQYLDWRTKKGTKSTTRANREKALISHIWNKARDWGYTSLANPCAGIAGYSEPGRGDVYTEQEVFDAVYKKADQPTRDYMDLIYLAGQRNSDILSATEADIKNGEFSVTQGKTKKRLRITIMGELAVIIDRIMARKRTHKIRSLALVVNEDGQRLTYWAARSRFDKARAAAAKENPTIKAAIENFQLRDLRAKAGTDKAESAGDIRQAQRLLGHTSMAMTEHYVRGRKGDKVEPTK